MNKVGETLSPWEMGVNFVQLWGWTEILWILITILLVYIIHKIATRVKHKEKASWIELLFWVIAAVGWAFIMYMIMWEKMNSNVLISITLLLGSCIGALVSFLIFFRIMGDPERRQIVGRIVSGSILAVIVFGILIFMGINQQEYGLAILMGGLLGGFISLIRFNFVNMSKVVTKPIVDEEEEPWVTPTVGKK